MQIGQTCKFHLLLKDDFFFGKRFKHIYSYSEKQQFKFRCRMISIFCAILHLAPGILLDYCPAYFLSAENVPCFQLFCTKTSNKMSD